MPILVALRQWNEEFDAHPGQIGTLPVDRENGKPVRKLALYSEDGCSIWPVSRSSRDAPGTARSRPDQESLRLLRSHSAASSCVMSRRCLSVPRPCRSAIFESSPVVSAMKAAASCGSPLPMSEPAGARSLCLRPPPEVLLKIRSGSCPKPGISRNSGVVKHNFRHRYSYGLWPTSISGDLTGAAAPPMFGSKRPAASLAGPA